ncbi:MAG: hypothetical protein AAB414_02345 [Patescibacteria group bacterium]
MKKFKKIFVNSYFLAVLFFAFISTIIIFSWFKYGLLYGGGDVGLPSYDPKRILDITKYIWWEAAAPGTTVPHGLTSVLLQLFQSLFQEVGLSYVAIQAVLFWLILFLSGYGMFLLALSILGKEKVILAILAGLFYMFNPYMMIQVWHRFIHNTFVLMAALPFFFIFWGKWIREGKPSSLLIFLLINFLAVSLFGALAFIVTIILLIFLISAFEVFIPWKGFNNLKSISFRMFIGLIAMLCIHFWWLWPAIKVVPPLVSTQHSASSNISTLISISNQSVIPFSLLGINPFYLYTNSELGEIFLNPFFLILPWLTFMFFIPGFLISLTTKRLAFWAIFWILAIFFAKGTAPPFGHIYEFVFSKFFILGILRNPYEKLGIFLPFSQSLLIVFGIGWLMNKFTRHRHIITGFSATVIFLCIGVFLWPMWLGKIFGTLEKPAFVKVPENYKNADKFISDFKGDGRILHLPLTVGEANSYTWEYGYNGVEPSQLIFKSLPSISRGFNVDFIDNSLSALTMIFKDNSTSESRILKILQDFNTMFIVLHKDVVWKGGFLQDPYEIEHALDNLPFLTKKEEFGDLAVYKLKDEFFQHRLVLSSNLDYLSGSYTGSFYPRAIKEKESGNFMSVLGINPDQQLFNRSSEIIVTPKSSWVYSSTELPIEQITAELPSVRILPNSPLYPLIMLKENTQSLSNSGQKELVFKITFAGKRLVEAYKMQNKGDSKHFISAILSYEDLIKDIFEKKLIELKDVVSIGPYPLADIFSRHRLILKSLIEESGAERDTVSQTYERLSTYLRENHFLPLHETDMYKVGNSLFRVVDFEIPSDGEYQIVLPTQDSENIYPDNLLRLKVEIDGKPYNLEGEKKGQFIHFSKVELSKGSHEIAFPLNYSIDLVKTPNNIVNEGNVTKLNDQFEVNSNKHGASFIEAEINPVASMVWYEVNFESWIQKGDRFRVQLIQDIDPPNPKNPEETLKEYDKYFSKDTYNHYWREHKLSFLLTKPFAKKAKVRLTVEPWDDCEIIVVKKALCKDKKFKFDFEHETIVAFRNFQIKRRFDNPIFLYSKNNEIYSSQRDLENTPPLGEITKFERRSPISIAGNIKMEREGFLIFKDSYHPGWDLRLNKDQDTYKPSKRYIANGFANAWFIEEPGVYSFELEFTPQKYVYLGIIIGISAVLIVLVFAIREKFKQ